MLQQNAQQTSFKTALDKVLNVHSVEHIWFKAHNGEYNWRLTCPIKEKVPFYLQQQVAFYFPSKNISVSIWSKAIRKDMVVESATEADQTCVYLSSKVANRSERMTRFDYNVVTWYNNAKHPGIIKSFLLAECKSEASVKSVFVEIELFASIAKEYSVEMSTIQSKVFYKTTSESHTSLVLPISALIHKCNVYKDNNKRWIWFP